MPNFTKQQLRRQNIVTIIVIAILIIGGLVIHGWFNHELLPVDTSDQTKRVVVIPKGTTDKQTGSLLKNKNWYAMPMCLITICKRTRRRGSRLGAFI